MDSSTIVKMEQVDGVTVVTLGARLDLVRAAGFRNELGAVREQTAHSVVLDLHQLEFLDSSGLGAIAALWKEYAQRRRGFAICNVHSEWISSILRMTRMDQLLPIHSSLEQAVAAARASGALAEAGV